MGTVKCIGILTSGGDAPGMNAAIRAVTRAGICNGFNIKGIYRGYEGLINGEIKPFTTENVSGIIMQGGTILKTARSKEFTTPEGMLKAYETMQKEEIDALVVIGGNGSLTGAKIFAAEYDVCCIGLPGTIDNDLYGTDSTIGYDTTMNTIVECVDRIRDTAQSHERIFFIEVMGRDAGFLAQTVPSPAVRRRPSSLRNRLSLTSWHALWSVAYASRRRVVSSSCRKVPSAVPCIMPTVCATSFRITMSVCLSSAICSVEVAPRHATAYLPAVRAWVPSKPSFKVSVT